MGNVKFIVYINDQSSKPLVHSIAEAKQYATRNIQHKPPIRIECYSLQFKISEWVYDYHAEEWIEQYVTSSISLYHELI